MQINFFASFMGSTMFSFRSCNVVTEEMKFFNFKIFFFALKIRWENFFLFQWKMKLLSFFGQKKIKSNDWFFFPIRRQSFDFPRVYKMLMDWFDILFLSFTSIPIYFFQSIFQKSQALFKSSSIYINSYIKIVFFVCLFEKNKLYRSIEITVLRAVFLKYLNYFFFYKERNWWWK